MSYVNYLIINIFNSKVIYNMNSCNISLPDQMEIPVCTSCTRPILPGGLSVKLQCPNCNEKTIWRCPKCRKFTRTYTCSACSFEGP
tara:strand:+ start:851 stop:1108 length:258 start_codon:yes stop_codon:yes gene_type:complete